MVLLSLEKAAECLHPCMIEHEITERDMGVYPLNMDFEVKEALSCLQRRML